MSLYADTLIEELSVIPSEEDKCFATLIREFNSRNFPDGLKRQFYLREIYENIENNIDYRFKAFYAHQVNYWRFSKHEQYRENVDKYEEHFESYKHFNNWRAQCHFTLGLAGNFDAFESALYYSDKAIKDLPNSPNVLSFKADILISIEELQDVADESKVLQAMDLIDKSISILNGKYARHIVTKSRAMSLLGKYTEAKNLINKAIRLEDTSAADYSLRIGEFNATRIGIIVREQKVAANKNTKSILKEVENLKVQLIELIGILVAVIALIITGTQVAKADDFNTIFPIFLTIGGINLMTFSSYSLIFYREIKRAQIVMLIIGFLLLFAAVIYHRYLLYIPPTASAQHMVSKQPLLRQP